MPPAADPIPVERVLDAARSYIGLEPSDPAYIQRVYLAHLPGGGTPLQRAQAQQMARTQSGCGLVAEAILRDLGVTWPHLWRWYGDRLGTAISASVAAARRDGIWYDDRSPGPGIQAGDLLVIGGPAPDWSRGGITYEHILVATELLPDGRLRSVDGGQPGVAERTRVLVRTPQGELWLAHLPPSGGAAQLGPDGRPLVGRRVQGWIKARLAPHTPAGYTGGGGTSGGGGATGSGGATGGTPAQPTPQIVCPPCPPPGGEVPLGSALAYLALAYLLGELTGQWVEEGRGRR